MSDVYIPWPDGRCAALWIGSVRCNQGWHARIVVTPPNGEVEIYECPMHDATEARALHRAHVLAKLKSPEQQTLH